MAVKFRPMHELVVVQPIQEEKMTAGGIVIPEAVDEKKPVKAKVVAVGAGRVLIDGTIRPLDVKVGDMVVYAPSAGFIVKYEDNDYTFVREGELIAVVTN